MLAVDAIAGRRLPLPNGWTGQLIATVSVGDASVTTKPAQPVYDSKMGYAITFREPIEIPLVEGSEYSADIGAIVSIRSADHSIDFGEATCTTTRQWYSFVPSCGEALCSFMLRPLSPTKTKQIGKPTSKRPNTAGAAASIPAWKVVDPTSGAKHHHPEFEWSGALQVRVQEVRGLAIPASRASVVAVVQFAMKEKHTPPVTTVITNTGHAAVFDEPVTFDILPHCLNNMVTVRFYGNFNERQSQFIGESKFNVDLDGPDHEMELHSDVSDNPRASANLHYHVTYHEPQREGSNGRPISAHQRSERHAVPSPLKVQDVSHTSSPQKSMITPNSASRLRTKVAQASPVSAPNTTIEDHGGPLLGSTALERVEARIASVVAETVDQIMGKLNAIESRVTRTEESLAQLKAAPPFRIGSARPRPSSSRSTGAGTTVVSRPSSAESYDVSQSMVTEVQMRNRFHSLDSRGLGYITKGQLVRFYKEHSTLDESDDAIERYLKGIGVGGIDTDTITFDGFATVALKLAQR